MTLGQKLSTYRKLAGLTQQQLGEQLSISAQAVSKWENDQTEPDLATMRTLAGIYRVSLDEMLDPDSIPHSAAEADAAEQASAESANATEAKPPIGFCKECGITVTEENLGEMEPVILCAKCLQAKKEAAAKAAAEAKRMAAKKKAAAAAVCAERKKRYKKHIVRSIVIAALVTALFLLVMITVMVDEFSGAMLAVTIVGAYVVFAFVWCLRYDCVVQNVVLDWMSKSIRWPGLIFTFDIDGCLWLIGMKLLFWALGLLFGVITGMIGGTIGLVCAPFVFPFLVRKVAKEYKSGEKSEVIEQSTKYFEN